MSQLNAMDTLSPDHNVPIFLSTEQQPMHQRHDWLQYIISQEYTHVAIKAGRDKPLFNEMTIYPWQDLRLSSIRSNGITIQRQAGECCKVSQDAYFAVILLSGQYMLEQNGREVFLQPGEMTLYDATRPHRIHCPGPFSKLIISIPRSLLRCHLSGVEHCTAKSIDPQHGIGAIGTRFIRSAAQYAASLNAQQFNSLAPQALELLAASFAGARPDHIHGRSRSISLHRVRQFIEEHLHDHDLNSSLIAAATGLSTRYINSLFADEGLSLMRYVWQRRLEKCRQALQQPAQHGQAIATIAFRWGFTDQAHFSRSFKQAFGLPPRAYRVKQSRAD